MQQKWTKKEVDFAIKKRKQGWTIFDISKKLGRSIRAVEKQLYSRGIRMDQMPQTDEEFINAEKRLMSTKAKEKFVKQLIKGRAGTQLIVDELQKIVPRIEYDYEPFKFKKSTGDEVVLVLELSDIHIGKVTNSYNVPIFKKRMEILTDRVVRMLELFRHTNKIEKLCIFGVGDWIDGDAIFPGQAFEIEGSKMKQIFLWGIPEFAKFLKSISPFFKEIELCCVKGNHGRNAKFDAQEVNWDLVFYESLKFATQNIKNVKWKITWEWYQIVNIFKWKFLLIHGDQMRMWMNLPFYAMTQKGMRWQGSIKEKWDYLILGHFHTPINFVWNNFEVIANGTFVSGDDWAQRELGMSSEESQILFLVHPRKGVINYNKIFFRR